MEAIRIAIILSLEVLLLAMFVFWSHRQTQKRLDELNAQLTIALRKLKNGTAATTVKATTSVRKPAVRKKPTPKTPIE